MTKSLTNRFFRGVAYSVLSPALLSAVPVYAHDVEASW